MSLRAWLLATAGILAVVAGGWFLLQNATGTRVNEGRFSAPPACARLPTPSVQDAEVSPTKSPPGTKDSVQCTWSVLPKDFADRGSITVEFKRYGTKNGDSGADNAHAAVMSAGSGDPLSGIGDEGHYIDASDPFAAPQVMFRVDNLTADISISDGEQSEVAAKNEAAYAGRLATALLKLPSRWPGHGRWRWWWDSNPRKLALHTLSRRAPSSTRRHHRGEAYRTLRRTKNSESSAPHSAASTPANTSGRWLRRRSRTTSHSDPTAPAFGSTAP